MRDPIDVIAAAIAASAGLPRDAAARRVLAELRGEFTVRTCSTFGYWSDATIIPLSRSEKPADDSIPTTIREPLA